MSDVTGYSRIQIVLHWVVAVLIILQFAFHEWISDAWDVIEKGGTADISVLVRAHIIGGILIFLLAAHRLRVRPKTGVPTPPKNEHKMLKMVANLTHWSFYALMFALPISGAAAWFGGIGKAADAHEILRGILLALVALHVLAALAHHFVLKTDVMARMLRADRG